MTERERWFDAADDDDNAKRDRKMGLSFRLTNEASGREAGLHNSTSRSSRIDYAGVKVVGSCFSASWMIKSCKVVKLPK